MTNIRGANADVRHQGLAIGYLQKRCSTKNCFLNRKRLDEPLGLLKLPKAQRV